MVTNDIVLFDVKSVDTTNNLITLVISIHMGWSDGRVGCREKVECFTVLCVTDSSAMSCGIGDWNT